MNKFPYIAALALSAAAMTSCESIYDDRSDCVTGIQLHFVHDYHMEPGANSFPANVDCISVYVFDKDGNYLAQYKETSENLANEDYRMVLPLTDGEYHLLVYGGMACEDRAFEWNADNLWGTDVSISPDSRSGFISDLLVNLPLDSEGVSRKKLHDMVDRTGGLFYGFQWRAKGEKQWITPEVNGDIQITVDNKDYGTTFTEYDVNLMKDTNNIQVILQEVSTPYQIDYNDYEFYIYDDNFRLDGFNRKVSVATDNYKPCYRPYSAENRIAGFVDAMHYNGAQIWEDDEIPVQVACVEFSTSRLFVDNLDTARLVIKSKESGRSVIDVPLITYLCLIRGMGYNWIRSDQEFLDRQSNWNLMFFLQNGAWLNTRIAVNAWIVRLDNINLGI